MVFPGRFSTGCSRCRQRKIKCDEARPSCQRCVIYGKECPGYTDQFRFRHRQFTSNSAQSQSPSSPASRSNGKRTTRKKEEGEKVSPSKTSKSLRIEPPLQVPCDDLSLSYFFARFVSPGRPDGFPGHLTFLRDMYDSHGNGILELATLSVAKMAAYHQFGGDTLRLQSYRSYGLAIKELQNAITSEVDVEDDRVLASIVLLCTLKDITGDSFGDSNAHSAGLFYFLEKRGVEQLATVTGAELFMLAAIRLQIYSFMNGDESYSNPGGVACVMAVFDPLVRIISMMSKTLALRHQLLKSITPPNSPHDKIIPEFPTLGTDTFIGSDGGELESVLTACFEMLEEFDSWDVEAASYWQTTFEDRTLPTALGDVGTSMTYCDPPTACTIILVRSARLIMLVTLFTYHGISELANGICGDVSAWENCLPTLHDHIHRAIDDIIACVPFALGDVSPHGDPVTRTYDGAGAVIITQPLRLITYCAYSKPAQADMARKILDRFYTGIGIRSALPWDGDAALLPELN